MLSTTHTLFINNQLSRNMNRLNEPAQKKRYQTVLRELMTYVDDIAYAKDHDFEMAQLAQLKPHDIYRWMCTKAFDMPDPGPDDHPVHGRSSSLMYYKKAISYFMPNRLMAWNELSLAGNPTRSVAVNDLIKAVKKLEVRKLGKKPKADRAMEKVEFEQMITILESCNDDSQRYMYPTMFKFQFHMVARLDDTARLEKRDIKPCPEFPFALLCQLCWSKNVREERDAPDQILLGAMDPHYCILLAFAIFLELWIGSGEGLLSRYVFGKAGNGAETTKDHAYQSFKCNVLDSNEFRCVARGPLGTHSNRKFGSTWPRRNGCYRDDVDCRGRWKRSRKQVDDYIDVTLPWPDAKVASKLCIGGPIKYVLKEGSGLCDDWLFEHVVPNILKCFEKEVAIVLALPLLWAVSEDERPVWVPEAIRSRILTAYSAVVRLLPIGENPVKRVPLVVTGDDGVVYMDEIGGNAQGDGGAGNRTVRLGDNTGDQLMAIYSQIAGVSRRQAQAESQTQLYHTRTDSKLEAMNLNLRRIAIQPVQRVQHGANEGNNNNLAVAEIVAALSPRPRNLHLLWQEYEFGLGGRKPARQFTAIERGRVKFKYCRRKVVWDIIDRMVRGGFTAQVAIDKIYVVYGHITVTQIINRMRTDAIGGGHPELR
jgi:hypothetical protein